MDRDLVANFEVYLRGGRKLAPAVTRRYARVVADFESFLSLEAIGEAAELSSPSTAMVSRFLTDSSGDSRAAFNHRYWGLVSFCRWLRQEGLLHDDPMEFLEPLRLHEPDACSCTSLRAPTSASHLCCYRNSPASKRLGRPHRSYRLPGIVWAIRVQTFARCAAPRSCRVCNCVPAYELRAHAGLKLERPLPPLGLRRTEAPRLGRLPHY